ncbi:MAG: alpha/beta fold hydrolase [Acidimicrobiia bacterium]|nr:alpha/beta fold hydrolase [Acidimicrobiia bacterium]MDH5292936.1 alpha/beta fold hydrolase [Acidimicrobiia bacterium]
MISLTRPAKPDSRFLEAGGYQLHYLEMGSGDGTPVVLLHGGGPGCTGWSDFGVCAPHMAGRRLFLFDLLQYGQSDKPDIDGPVWSSHAAVYAAAIAELGIERAHLVCNSWGGACALAMGIEHPDVVASLVITGSMPVQRGPFGPLIDHSWRGRFARLDYYGEAGPTWDKMRALIARFEWYDESKIPDETVTMRYEQSLDPGELRLGLAIDERGRMQNIGPDLPKIEAPTLFVWGMEDDFLGPDYPLSLAASMPRGNLHVMDRASHHLQEERPLEYALSVNAFLDRVEEVGS